MQKNHKHVLYLLFLIKGGLIPIRDKGKNIPSEVRLNSFLFVFFFTLKGSSSDLAAIYSSLILKLNFETKSCN